MCVRATDRAARAAAGGDLGPLHRLLPIVGMGGATSARLWIIGVRRLVCVIVAVVCRRCPAYADGAKALVCGPRGVVVGQLVRVAASHAAGPHVERGARVPR